MKFRLIPHWSSDDILPSVEEFDSSRQAARRYRELTRIGANAVSVFVVEDGISSRISPTRLRRLALEEDNKLGRLTRSARRAVASAVLGMIASALPSAFGDFGLLSSSATMRVARVARSDARRKPSFPPIAVAA